MVFVAAAASIVSGAVAERMETDNISSLFSYLTGLIYPIQGSWTWGGGWLGEMGFGIRRISHCSSVGDLGCIDRSHYYWRKKRQVWC